MMGNEKEIKKQRKDMSVPRCVVERVIVAERKSKARGRGCLRDSE